MKEVKVNNTIISVKDGTTFKKIADEHFSSEIPIILGNFNNEIVELNEKVNIDGTFFPIFVNNTNALRCYERTLQFVMIVAAKELFKNAKVQFENSINKGIYGEIYKDSPLEEKEIIEIKEKMTEIINSNMEINKSRFSKDEAIEIFEKQGFEHKIELLDFSDIDCIDLYELKGLYDCFYGPMGSYTGILKLFDLIPYKNGFLLKYPSEDSPLSIEPLAKTDKLFNIFYETRIWNDLLDISYTGSLNEKVKNKEIIDIIRVSEALHEKKIAYIADKVKEKEIVKMVLISGPSSSGKTTFSKRLGIQLRVNGYIPIQISLDDYFVNREDTPKDENGDYDFESINALDLELFNKQLVELLDMKEVEIPSFNFHTGQREWVGNKLKLPSNGILVIEGIHGLNEKLTNKIPKENKFKVYISALTQLNLDSHTSIHTSDVRIIRRLVRDKLSRGYSGETTLKMFPSVKKGENKNIFPFQEKANVMFNSTLPYEFLILKRYAMAELGSIQNTSETYFTAQRLMNILKYFDDIDANIVPENSIIREFIGGSCFYKY